MESAFDSMADSSAESADLADLWPQNEDFSGLKSSELEKFFRLYLALFLEQLTQNEMLCLKDTNNYYNGRDYNDEFWRQNINL